MSNHIQGDTMTVKPGIRGCIISHSNHNVLIDWFYHIEKGVGG